MLTYICMIYPDIRLEKILWKIGKQYIAGLDEAGRGPLAGPVVAAAVVITSPDQVVGTVRDSKRMTENQRNIAFELIKDRSEAFGIGIVSEKEIDKVGIKRAVHDAMMIAVSEVEKKLKHSLDYIIADGGIYLLKGYDMESINKGDENHYSIAAASVLAKVTRDRIMLEYAKKYPKYSFDSNVGYGTKQHIKAIKKHGLCDIHRKSFEPIKSLLDGI
jgi:ribonuclease HII